MTTYTSAINNSKTDLEGLVKHIRSLVTGGVPTNFNPTSMQVVQRAAGANMSVDVSVGDVHLVRPTSDYSFWGWQDAATNVAITTAPASNSRIDAIVAWIDTSVTNISLNNSPGSLKFSAIVGTVAGSPVAPIDSAIQTALGSTVAWTRLANVTVGTSVTSIVNANISDQRTAIKLRAAVPTAAIEDGAVTNAKLASGASSAKLSNPYKFSAYNSTTTGIAASFVPTKIAFQTEEYDTGNNFDATTNYRFTAPVAGFYQFNAAVQSGSGADAEFFTIYLYKNGSPHKTGTGIAVRGANSIFLVVAPPPLQLAANDYVEVFAAQNSAGIKNTLVGAANTYFGGYLVSTT